MTSGAKAADLLRLIAAHAGSMRADCVHDARTGELDAEATLKGCRGKANLEMKEERALRDRLQAENARLRDRLKSIANTIAFDSLDWSLDSRHAWIYGVAVGWNECLPEMAAKHGWSSEDAALLSALAPKPAEKDGG